MSTDSKLHAAVATSPTTLPTTRPVLFEDAFDGDLRNWSVEMEQPGVVRTVGGQLEVDVPGGCSVWFRSKISGPVMIEYDAAVVSRGGPNDRVSDLNCFWMATDPRSAHDLFASQPPRTGKFSNYDQLRTYYVGYGGNNNTTTRFRRYRGDGEKPLLPEHDLKSPEVLLKANQWMHITLIANGSRIEFHRDKDILMVMDDALPYTNGWFGFRTAKSHILFDNFRVLRLPAQPEPTSGPAKR